MFFRVYNEGRLLPNPFSIHTIPATLFNHSIYMDWKWVNHLCNISISLQVAFVNNYES